MPDTKEVHVKASHLSNTDEDWGSMPPPKSKVPTDEELEKELAGKDFVAEEDEEDEEPKNDAAPDEALVALEKLQNGDMENLIGNLKQKQEELKSKREKLIRELEAEENLIKRNIKVAMMLAGQTPIEEDAPKKRGRRPGSTNKPPENNPTDGTPATPPADGEPQRTASGKRFDNKGVTLKQAIVKTMKTHMPKHTGNVNEITVAVMDPAKGGYHSTSTKPTNTVRIQVYELEKEEMLSRNSDGTFTLTEKGLNS